MKFDRESITKILIKTLFVDKSLREIAAFRAKSDQFRKQTITTIPFSSIT